MCLLMEGYDITNLVPKLNFNLIKLQDGSGGIYRIYRGKKNDK